MSFGQSIPLKNKTKELQQCDNCAVMLNVTWIANDHNRREQGNCVFEWKIVLWLATCDEMFSTETSIWNVQNERKNYFCMTFACWSSRIIIFDFWLLAIRRLTKLIHISENLKCGSRENRFSDFKMHEWINTPAINWKWARTMEMAERFRKWLMTVINKMMMMLLGTISFSISNDSLLSHSSLLL